jgi:hypothetical protein
MVLDAAAKVTKGGIARSRPASSSRFAACVTFVNKLDREGPGLLDEIEQSLALDVTPAPGRSALRRDHLDQRREAPKIHFIEGQQPPLAMRQHGRDDIGVMDLTTSEGIAAAQLHEVIPHRRAVLEHVEAPHERRNVRGRFGEDQSPSSGLLSRHHSDILAQDLSADGKWFAGGQLGESGAGPVAERRAAAVA